MTEEPREPTIERADAPLVHDGTGAVVGVLRNDVRNEAAAIAEATAPLPVDYRDITQKIMANCSPRDLIRYSIQAQQDERWDRVEMFQWELVKRQPQNIVAHIQLARAFAKQGKMDDAAGLMTTIEELRTSRDDVKVIHAILGLKRWLAEAAAKTHARRPAENPAPTSPAAGSCASSKT